MAVRTHLHNAPGQVETVSDALGNSTTYTHDALGQVTGITDAVRHTKTFTYRRRQNRHSDRCALGSTGPHTRYDGNGNLTSVTDSSAIPRDLRDMTH